MTEPSRDAQPSREVRAVTRESRGAWARLRTALWPGTDDGHAAETEAHFGGGDPRWPQEVFLAEEDGTVLGFAEVSVRPVAEGCETRDVGYLEGWYVSPEARGQGWGRALLRASEAWARERGCREMASDTEPENTGSLRAHLACGFEEAGLVRCFRREL